MFQKYIQKFFRAKETDAISKTMVEIFIFMLGANVLKGGIYLYESVTRLGGEGTGRSIRLMVTSLLLILLIKHFNRYLSFFVHYAVIATILHIYYRSFSRDVGLDMIAFQAIVMVLICSYYALGRSWGTFYSAAAMLSCFSIALTNYRIDGLKPLPAELNYIYIGINWIVILLSHFYFQRVLFDSLRKEKELAEQLTILAESRSRFLSTISHEIRTPLNSVIGISGLLKAKEKDSTRSEQLEMLHISADTLLSLINNVLDINKLESNQLILEKTSFNLRLLINQIAAEMKYKAEGKGISMSCNLGVSEVPYLLGDPTRLRQVLSNIMDNAVKFTHSGGVTINVSEMERTGEDILMHFEIADTGIGLTNEQQATMFEPFQQASVSTTRYYGGTGLGLSIVQQLLHMMHSEIIVDSTPGLGTKMSFDLRFDLDKNPKVLETVSSQSNKESLAGMRILLAEDNKMNIFYMNHLLKQWHVSADIVSNGKDALALLVKQNYDVVLMDINMPLLDGIKTTAEIRKMPDIQKSSVYIIALTASVSGEIKRDLLSTGIDDFLQKPFEADDLRKKLETIYGKIMASTPKRALSCSVKTN